MTSSPPTWRAAVRPSPDGIALDVEVVPGADTTAFPTGYNPWRRRLQARVQAPPTEGRANEELKQTVAERFGVRSRDVEVVEGATSRQKRLRVTGLTLGDAQSRLAEVLDAR